MRSSGPGRSQRPHPTRPSPPGTHEQRCVCGRRGPSSAPSCRQLHAARLQPARRPGRVPAERGPRRTALQGVQAKPEDLLWRVPQRGRPADEERHGSRWWETARRVPESAACCVICSALPATARVRQAEIASCRRRGHQHGRRGAPSSASARRTGRARTVSRSVPCARVAWRAGPASPRRRSQRGRSELRPDRLGSGSVRPAHLVTGARRGAGRDIPHLPGGARA